MSNYFSDDILFSLNKTKSEPKNIDENYFDTRDKFQKYHLEKSNIEINTTDENVIRTNSNNNSTFSTNIDNKDLASHEILIKQSKSFNVSGQRSGIIGERFIQTQKTLINIDSSQRRLNDYPNPNNYKIELPRIFNNVQSIELMSLEFPNTQQLIREFPSINSNNKIYWYNEDDIIDNELQLYIATLPAGNYDTNTLKSTIETQMNSVRRIGTGEFHNITVDINTETDVVTFSSIEFNNLTNPFTIGTTGQIITDISVKYTNHPFDIGDRVQVNGSNSIGGIDSSFINTEHVITEITDINNFVFQVNSTATELVIDGGGSSVAIGTGIRWNILWSQPNTPFEVLGFENIDTGFDYEHSNTEERYVYYDDPPDNTIGQRLKINEIYTTLETASIYSLIRTTKDHLLETGDRIFIVNDETINTYDHLYGLSEGSLTTEDNENRKRFVAQLLNPAGHIITKLSDNIIQLPVPYVTIPDIETAKDTAIITGLEEYGEILIKTLNKKIDLVGEKYVFLSIPGLNNYISTREVSDIFYKVQLSGPSNSTIYNSYIGSKKIYYDSPLSLLNELKIEWRTKDGNLFEFSERDHSFTLEITETLQKIEGTGFSSKIGTRT